MTDDIPLRADAQRNRERLLAAAEAVFLERGADASMEDVARRAGVGIGTLYRRFPTREALLAAAYSARFLSLAAASQARTGPSGAPDPLNALRAYLHELVAQTSVYRGLAASLGAVLQSGTPGCEATIQEGQRLLREAQASGVVRRDVTFDDLVVVIMAASLATGAAPASDSRIDHLIGLFIDGIAGRGRQASVDAPPAARRRAGARRAAPG